MQTQMKKMDQDTEIILRDRIFSYIFNNPHGVNIKELEAKFGESRMRLGYILNKLHEESKIRKASNFFYPIVGL